MNASSCFHGLVGFPWFGAAYMAANVLPSLMIVILSTPAMERTQNPRIRPIFVQGHSKIHNITKFLKETGYWIERYPCYYPDLNPIENAWTELKRRLQGQYPNIKDIPDGPDKVKEMLVELLPLV